jgi:hypothetical protein
LPFGRKTIIRTRDRVIRAINIIRRVVVIRYKRGNNE